MNDYKGLRVAFLHPRLEGGGAERVSLTTAKLFSEWGIHSVFIGYEHNKNEFVLPEDSDASIYTLPDNSGFCSDVNKEALKAFITENDIKLAFVCYLDGSFFKDKLDGVDCKFLYWNHSAPFWEYDFDLELGQMGAKYSIKKWLQWHILGRKSELASKEKKALLMEKYRADISIFDKYIVLCPEYKEQISEALKLSEEEEAKLVPLVNTIPCNEQANLEKKQEVVFVSRLSLVPKRFDRMLKIWHKVQSSLSDWTLKIYGAGPDEWVYHKLVKKYKLKNIEYCGYETDLSKIYDTASIVCLTSTFEGWPMVFVEAQNDAVIPVAFDVCGGIRTIIGTDQRAGRLIKPFDLEAYAEVLVELCQNEELREELQQNCLVKRNDYNPHVNDEAWAKLFDELLGNNNQ